MLRKKIKRRLLIGGMILLILSFAVVFGMIRINLDVDKAIWALAALVVAYGFYALVIYFTTPQKQVTLITRVEMTSPPKLMRSVKNYRLKISSEKHIEDKGRERIIKMDELIMSFNSSDHSYAYQHCMELISHHIKQNIDTARISHPDAEVIGSPLVLPPAIESLKDSNDS